MFKKDSKKMDKHKTHDRRPGARDKTSSSTRNLEKFVVEEIELSSALPQAAPQGRVYKAPPAWLPAAKRVTAWVGVWLMVVLASLFARGPWPVEETRLLAIAWEMWVTGDFLIPRLNGAVSVHLSPLLFWSTQAGWWLFEVNDWWPRLVPALFALASLFLTGGLARFLWPGQKDIARYAPAMLAGVFFWAFYTGVAAADMLLVFSTLLTLYGFLWAWRHRDNRVWLFTGTALGLGLLAHGGLVLFYVAPAVMLAPFWGAMAARPNWRYWYADALKVLVLGVAIYCAWAVPAGMQVGAVPVLDTFFAPFSFYNLEVFGSVRPWWWYLFLVPLLSLPWSVWPLVWMRLWFIRRQPLNPGLLFCMFWPTVMVALLSLVPVKQPQFLLPLLPAFVLAAAYLLFDDHLAEDRHDGISSTMTFPVILIGALLAIFPGLPRVDFLPSILWELSPFVGIALVLVGMSLAWLPGAEVKQRVANMTGGIAAVCALLWLTLGWQWDPVYNTRPIADILTKAEQKAWPVAHAGAYDGRYHFAGRLRKPITVLDKNQVTSWFSENPRGVLITYDDSWQPKTSDAEMIIEHSSQDRKLRFWVSKAP